LCWRRSYDALALTLLIPFFRFIDCATASSTKGNRQRDSIADEAECGIHRHQRWTDPENVFRLLSLPKLIYVV